MRFKKSLVGLVAGIFAFGLLGVPALHVRAATQAPIATAKVSFTFDDGYATAYTQAAPTLAKYGLTGTDYVVPGCIGMTTAPNACHADTGGVFMTWAQVKALRTTYGWEIGSHTQTHPYLASSDASDGQPNVLTPAQVEQELSQSKAALAAQGISATSFASPYGDYSPAVLAKIAKYYTSHRGFADTGYNAHPYNDLLLRDQQVQVPVSVATVKGYIDQAIANKTWLVLSFHDIKPTPSTNVDDYEYSTSNLDQIAAYAKSKIQAGVLSSVNVSQGLTTSDTNLLANGGFESGLSQGWTADVPTITADAGGNGSVAGAAQSIKLAATTRNGHLFSPKVSIDPAATYALKQYLNVQSKTNGEIAFYIDEYDAAGKWISGQYKAAERSIWVASMNFTYKATSAAAKQARLQVIVSANSGITAYFDSFQWFATTAVTPPSTTNLLANSTFDAGIASGWTTNAPATIVADSASNGSPSNIVKSVKATSTDRNTHLFSPKAAVRSGINYAFNSYLKLAQITSGEVGYYVDEYDATRNWISGKYITGVRSVSTGTVNFGYTPSSTAVTNARLQIIITGNSGIVAYIDDVVWTLN